MSKFVHIKIQHLNETYILKNYSKVLQYNTLANPKHAANASEEHNAIKYAILVEILQHLESMQFH